MRVALIPSAYAPSIGGVEELTRHLARHLTLAGDEVQVWTTRPDAADEAGEVDGVPVFRFAMPLPPARLGPAARFPVDGGRALRGLLGAVRRFRPQVLHVQCFGPNGAYATVLSELTRVPLVITLQGETMMDDHDIFDASLILRSALRVAVRRAAAVTGCSQFVIEDAVARFGLAPTKGGVIFNGVDLAESEHRHVSIPFDRFLLGLGRLVHKKGFDLLLDAFPEVLAERPALGLVIAGSGQERSRLEEHANRLGIADSVHFTGPLDRGQVASVMERAQLFVMPSRLEPFGIVVLEAWRAGCPVVVSGTGGAREFVRDGVTGIVVDPADRTTLARAITTVVADEDWRSQLVANGLERVRDFDWKVITNRYRDLYCSVLGAARQGVESRLEHNPEATPF